MRESEVKAWVLRRLVWERWLDEVRTERAWRAARAALEVSEPVRVAAPQPSSTEAATSSSR